MENKSNNPRLKQSEITNLLDLSSSTIQRYREEIIMLSPYRIPPLSKTSQTKQKTPNTNLDDVKVTSNDPKMTSNEPVNIKKNKLKGGGIEINEQPLDKIVHKNYL